MADVADVANDLMQERIDQALAARKPAPVSVSFEYCIDCDDAIPQARRLAARGCMRCAGCQQILELRGARYAG
jgi:phage/conjugal plasmid C-4 type zinc finger TraR family protein